jgi:hypothetical protein
VEDADVCLRGEHRQLQPVEERRQHHVPSGAEIPGDHPRLEGDGKLVRTMRFADLDELEAGRTDLEAAVRAWCDWKTG